MKKTIGITCAAIVVAAVIVWVVIEAILDKGDLTLQWLSQTVWKGWLFPNGWNLFSATPLFWIIVALFVVGALWVWYDIKEKISPVPRIVGGIAGVGIVVLVVGSLFMMSDWNARHYNTASTYKVENTNALPNSLVRISESGSKQQVGIETGTMPDQWVKRSASSTGATYVMRKTGDSNNNTELLTDSITYIYDTDGDGGAWTAIRNGTHRQPLFSISSWKGTGESITNCEFKGEFELNYAFGGMFGKNLDDKIAAFKRDFIYDSGDVYGYCDKNEPVIVIPGTKVVGNHLQVASDAYGVITVRGSRSGEPAFDYLAKVEPGELPGPVYPLKLVEQQRDSLSWSAGRVWFWETPVGYEAVDTPDRLLKSKEDGRLYWVTLLKPQNTDSLTIVAYSMTPADTIQAGKFNKQQVFVLNDGDTRSVNFNDLANAVTQAVAKADPGFFTGDEDNRGNIVEFIPTSSDSWQVFAERGGRAVYKIEVSGGQRMHTSVIAIDEETGAQNKQLAETPTGDPAEASCDTPSSLSTSQIASCMQMLSNELASRSRSE